MDLTKGSNRYDLSKSGDSLPTFQFLNLPVEILVEFPDYLEEIEDFAHLSCSCRYLQELYSTTSPNKIFQLAASSSSIFFKPSPHFLIAAVAKQVGEWALQSPENRLAFHNSFQTEGIEGLFELCKRVGRLTMEDIRELYEIKRSVLDPIAIEISKECGPRSRINRIARPRSATGVGNDLLICEDPEISLLQLTMFGDFFAASIRAVYDPQVMDPFSPSIRKDWWAKCCPDVNCPTSPRIKAGEPTSLNMLSLNILFISDVWTNGWSWAKERLAEKFPPDLQPLLAPLSDTPESMEQFHAQQLKESLWEQTLKGQGLRGMHLLLYGGIANVSDELIETRRMILGMNTSHIVLNGDRRSDLSWTYRVTARADIYASLRWV